MSLVTINIYTNCEHGHKTPPTLDVKIGPTRPKKEVKAMIEAVCTNEEKVQVTLSPKTHAGNPATLDGKPTWTKLSGDGDVQVADDGLSAFLVSGSGIGDTTYQVDADADLGSAVQTISAQLVLHVVSPMADNLGVLVAAPVPK